MQVIDFNSIMDRWQSNARVQARAQRNGRIVHAAVPMRRARDAAVKVLGERLLNKPWLCGYLSQA